MKRYLFATDLHGHLPSYRALFARAREEEAAGVWLGGDLLPHTSGRGPGPLRDQRRFLREVLRPDLEALAGAGVPLSGVLGNDDWAAVEPALLELEREGLFRPLHGRVHELGEGLWLAGYSGVPLTPFRMSDWDRLDEPGWEPRRVAKTLLFSEGDEVREGSVEEVRARPTIASELAALAERLPAPRQTVLVAHSPPYGTTLDRMHGGASIGSRALRRWIETHQPLLTLHGHVHESPRLSGEIQDRLGETLCCNPGDSRRRLRALRIELSPSRVEVARL